MTDAQDPTIYTLKSENTSPPRITFFDAVTLHSDGRLELHKPTDEAAELFWKAVETIGLSMRAEAFEAAASEARRRAEEWGKRWRDGEKDARLAGMSDGAAIVEKAIRALAEKEKRDGP